MSACTLHTALPGRSRLLLQAVLLTLGVVLACGLLPVASASAAPVAIAQCNGTAGGGQELNCDVDVVNTFDATTGVGSSTVTVRACSGAAGAANTCVGPTTTAHPDVTTSVSQCNGSLNAGGDIVTCSVSVTNNITGGTAPTAATVRQCVGSGGAGTASTCTPPQNTGGAAVDQCNGSVTGGGGALTCTVASGSTQSASLPVTVNQCNGTATGGGSFLTCRASITTNLLAAPAPPQPTTPAPAVPSPAASPAPASPATPSPEATPAPALPTPSAAPVTSANPVTSAAPAPSTAPTAPRTGPVARPQAAPTRAPGAVVGPVQALPRPVAPALAGVPELDGGNAAERALARDLLGGGSDAAGSVDDQGSAGRAAGSLARTGTDTGVLSLVGLVATLSGGVLLLVARRPRPARGRHALR